MTSKARELADAIGERETAGGLVSGRKNLIINGAMQVAQRGTSSTADTAGAYYTLDRFYASSATELGSFDTAQSTDAPNGFSNSFKFSVDTAGSGSVSTQQTFIQQLVEAQNLQHLAYGTSDAKEMTLSFWAKSTETGNKVVWFYSPDSMRHYAQTFALSQANTWEYFTISIPADTSGNIDNDNNAGLYIRFILESGTGYSGGIPDSGWTTLTNNRYSGTANFMQTASNEFYLTGVQLEVGSVATPFEHRSYGEELALCQRYFISYLPNGTDTSAIGPFGAASSSTSAQCIISYPVTMRAVPTASGNELRWSTPGGTSYDITGISAVNTTTSNMRFVGTTAGSLTGGNPYFLRSKNTGNGYLYVDAEL